MNTIFQRFRKWIANQFEAGQMFRQGRSYLQGNVQDSRYDLPPATRSEIIRKSRYFEKNSGLVNRLCDLFEQYTVGPSGLLWNPASSDSAWNTPVKSWLDGWYPIADIASRQSWAVIQSLIARTWFIDGECFVLKTRGIGVPAYPRVQLVETHRVATPPALSAREGKDIFEGIEIDTSTGRPLAYWIADTFSGETFRRIEAQFVIHVFEPARPGQLRGLPMLYPVLNDLHDLDDLQILEMKAAKDAAEVTNVLNTESGENKLGARTVRQRFQIVTQNGSGTDITQDRTAYVRQAIGGRTLALKIGEQLQQFKNDRPSAATSGYWEKLEHKICAGVGIPRSLVFAASMQGTVVRGEYDVAAIFFQSRSQVLIDAFKEVYKYVVWEASRIERAIADKPADWEKVSIRTPRAVNVDKGRVSYAQVTGLAAGIETLDSILAPQGIDWRDHVDQAANELQYILGKAEEKGIEPQMMATRIANSLQSAAKTSAVDPAMQPTA